MQLPTFNQAAAMWDQHRAFHNNHIPRYRWTPSSAYLVQFDTGEAIFTSSLIHREQRRRYDDFNISLLSPRDFRFPKVKTPGGQIIPSSWLTRGASQHFIIDHDSGHVVALGDIRKRPDLPVRFRGSAYNSTAYAYLAGPGCVPIGAPVRLVRTKNLTTDERKHISNLRALCRAWMQFSPDVDMEQGVVMVERFNAAAEQNMPVHLTWDQCAGLGQSYLLTVENIVDMDPLDRCRLAVHGSHGVIERVEVPHLLVV